MLEKLHLKFCKTILGVRQSTCNAAVYGELGRYPLYINRYLRIIKYWFKTCKSNNILTNTIVDDAITGIENGKTNWFSNVKSLLSRYGFLNVWQNIINTKESTFLSIFKQRLLDEFLQEWQRNLNNSSVLSLYRDIKSSFGFQTYLDKLVSRKLRIALTKLRVSGHSLRVHTGRYDRLERNMRVCQICNSHELEDEYHFVFNCKPYHLLRNRYIKTYFRARPSMYKFIDLLSTQNTNELYMLSKYVFEATNLRNVTINRS